MNHLEKLAVVGKILSNAAAGLKGSQRHVLNSAEKARFLKSPGLAPHKVVPSRPSSAQWKADIAATKAKQLKRYPPTAGPAGGPGVTGPPRIEAVPGTPFNRRTPGELRYTRNKHLGQEEAAARRKELLGVAGLGATGVTGAAAYDAGLFD
jgi:hypothetical protein